jgi:hypothetical protein
MIHVSYMIHSISDLKMTVLRHGSWLESNTIQHSTLTAPQKFVSDGTHTLTQASLCEHASWPLTGDGTLELASKAAPCTFTAAQIEHRSEHSHGKRTVGTNQGGGSAYPFRV